MIELNKHKAERGQMQKHQQLQKIRLPEKKQLKKFQGELSPIKKIRVAEKKASGLLSAADFRKMASTGMPMMPEPESSSESEGEAGSQGMDPDEEAIVE